MVPRYPDSLVNGSPVNGNGAHKIRYSDNGSLVNEFRREVPVNRTVRLAGTECIFKRQRINCDSNDVFIKYAWMVVKNKINIFQEKLNCF